jgi:hypothetical protein
MTALIIAFFCYFQSLLADIPNTQAKSSGPKNSSAIKEIVRTN